MPNDSRKLDIATPDENRLYLVSSAGDHDSKRGSQWAEIRSFNSSAAYMGA
jgi:hypothetical protein